MIQKMKMRKHTWCTPNWTERHIDHKVLQYDVMRARIDSAWSASFARCLKRVSLSAGWTGAICGGAMAETSAYHGSISMCTARNSISSWVSMTSRCFISFVSACKNRESFRICQSSAACSVFRDISRWSRAAYFFQLFEAQLFRNCWLIFI